jgi:probable rRNA maturation factor
MIECEITYSDESLRQFIDHQKVEKAVHKLFSLLELDFYELSISFVTDKEMRVLNKNYRNIDETTDVLSFSQIEDEDLFVQQEDSLTLLGDIIISVDELRQNAAYFNEEVDVELMRLVIHGILHLLGWDHTSNEATEEMLQKQEMLLLKISKELNS